MFRRMPQVTESIKRELRTYRAVLRHPRTPRFGKGCLGLAIAYALLSFDLIPDFIPVVGHLDDVVVIPLLIAIAVWFIPDDIVAECRGRRGG